MARIFLNLNEVNAPVAGDGAEVFGQRGDESIEILSGYTGIVLDQNIEEVVFQGNQGGYVFQQQGINLLVKNSSGDTIATIPVQNDDDGTLLTFADRTVSAGFDGSDIEVGEGSGGGGDADLYPSAEEQLMLEILNSERAAPDAYASQYGIDLNEGLAEGTISSDPKQPLAFDTALAEAARAHSLWMLENDIFSHTGIGGSNPGNRIEAEGYDAYSWGENLAWLGSWPSVPDTAESTVQLEENLFVDEGYPERGHRTNMLNEGWTQVGLGIETGIFTSDGQAYNAVMATQDFAIPATQEHFLVGVAFMDDDADMFYDVGEGLPDVQVAVTDLVSGEILNFATWDSGGYQVALEDGLYNVSFSWEDETFSTGIAMSGINEKVDWILIS